MLGLAPNGINPGLFRSDGSKLGQIGPQIVQIRGFFISDFSASVKSDLKKPRICPIWGPIWPTLEPNLPSLSSGHRVAILSTRLAQNGTNLGLCDRAKMYWQLLMLKTVVDLSHFVTIWSISIWLDCPGNGEFFCFSFPPRFVKCEHANQYFLVNFEWATRKARI